MTNYFYGRYSSLLIEYLSCFKIFIVIYNAANEIMESQGILILKAQKLLTCFPKGFNQFRLPIEMYEKAHFMVPSSATKPLEKNSC